MSDRNKVLANIKRKLGSLPVKIGLTDNDIDMCLDDALREMNLSSVSSVADGSKLELYVEIKSLWFALSIARNSGTTNFKYSTGSDGKMVDKTKISETISDIMNDLDMRFNRWYISNISGVAQIPRRESTTLVGDQ